MDISILKIIGLATLAILAVLGIALFAKEEFDLRRGSGATVLEAVLQTLWSYVLLELIGSFVIGVVVIAVFIGVGVGFIGLMIIGWREVIEILTSLDNAKP